MAIESDELCQVAAETYEQRELAYLLLVRDQATRDRLAAAARAVRDAASEWEGTALRAYFAAKQAADDPVAIDNLDRDHDLAEMLAGLWLDIAAVHEGANPPTRGQLSR